MGFFKKSTSAIGKLVLVILLAGAFLAGMAGVVILSLQGNVIQVPEIVGKNFNDSEKELTDLGLRIKRRADRFSAEPAGTILEQVPKPGETVKTGQMILVVTSKSNPEGSEPPATIKKEETDDSDKIEELISDKPKKKANSNTRKKSSTRDILSNSASNTTTGTGDSDKTTPSDKPTKPGDTTKPGDSTKPPTSKTPSGDSKRKTP